MEALARGGRHVDRRAARGGTEGKPLWCSTSRSAPRPANASRLPSHSPARPSIPVFATLRPDRGAGQPAGQEGHFGMPAGNVGPSRFTSPGDRANRPFVVYLGVVRNLWRLKFLCPSRYQRPTATARKHIPVHITTNATAYFHGKVSDRDIPRQLSLETSRACALSTAALISSAALRLRPMSSNEELKAQGYSLRPSFR